VAFDVFALQVRVVERIDIIERHYLDLFSKQFVDEMAAYETCAAGDEYFFDLSVTTCGH
jgi:hypothetical protein